jgi:DNA gyrase subunit B
MLYRLVPTLIEEGRVYIAESPLFEITHKNKKFFAYTEQDKVKITSKLSGKYTIQRSKGLGENEPEMMWETTMNPESRRLIKINPDEAMLTESYFEMLIGDNLIGRKNFIEENGGKYLDMLDIS